MKKLSTLLILLFSLSTFSQAYQSNAPWMKNLLQKKGKPTLEEISKAAEKYFNTIDRNKKGSGLKPFKRWEYHWSHYTKPDGTIAPASDLWTAWKQKKAMSTFAKGNATNTSNWKSLGPFNSARGGVTSPPVHYGQGRVNVVAVDPSNPNTYYVGAPAGGLWKSTNAGINWQSLTDYLPQIGVSGIAIHPKNSNIIYIATGDDDNNDSYAVGVMKSTDGGATWNTAGVISAYSMNEIYIDPTNYNTVLVATSDGVYKSINAGTSWKKTLPGNIIDLKMKPGDNTTWYAASGTTIYKSTNAGNSFNSIAISGFSNSSRITLDVTPANSNYVYFVSSKSNVFNGVYKSTNSGATFVKTAESKNIFQSKQAYYDLALTVSDTNPEIVFVGVLNIWKSTNGGNNFTELDNYVRDDSYTHSDIHFLRFINGKFFAGTDGGVYVSTDHGSKFTDLGENLVISQFYKISISNQKSNSVIGGTQDNGGFAYNNERTWRNYHGWDGMDCVISPKNPNTYYGFVQNGTRLEVSKDAGRTLSGSVPRPSSENYGRWVTPLTSDSKGGIYSGYSQLYKLSDGSWKKISNQSFGGYIANIEIDPNNDNNIYVSASGVLFKSTDAGATFTEVDYSSDCSCSVSGTIRAIEISSTDSNTAWVLNNYEVFKTTNMHAATPTFTTITGNLPQEGVRTIKHHARSANNRVYLGTALGVYYIDDTATDWQIFDNNLPNVAIRDLEIHEEDAKLYAATYGRGLFVSDIPRELPVSDIRLMAINNPKEVLYCGGDIAPIITVKNQGKNSITSATITYNIDGLASKIHNWSGIIEPGKTTEITIPTNNWPSGSHLLTVESTTANDAYASNNSLNISFTLNEASANPTVVNTFEDSSDTLLVETQSILDPLKPTLHTWQYGTPNKALLNTVGSGTKAYVTRLTGTYENHKISYLYTNCYDLSSVIDPVLKFKMAFDLGPNVAYVSVEYSTNEGEDWAILGSVSDENWYNSKVIWNGLPGNQWTGKGSDTNALGGTNATLHDYNFDLSAFKNEAGIIFRFKFGSAHGSTNFDGVLIDDVLIDGVLSVDEFNNIEGLNIYPNPSENVFNIQWKQGSDFSISIYDVTGRQILKKKNTFGSGVNLINVDMSSHVKGIYFAKIIVDGKQATKKLILK